MDPNSAYRKYQQQVMKTEMVEGHPVYYINFAPYTNSNRLIKKVASALRGRNNADLPAIRHEFTEETRLDLINSTHLPATIDSEEDIISLLTLVLSHHNKSYVDEYVSNRADELESEGKTRNKKRLRRRAFALVRRGVENTGLNVERIGHPNLTDKKTATVLAWGRFMGIALSFEDAYAVCVCTISWKEILPQKTSVSKVTSKLSALFDDTEKTLSPLGTPALPEPKELLALESGPEPDKNTS